MSEIIHEFYCPVCHYTIEVTIRTNYDCPFCVPKIRMTYRTSRPRK